MPPDQRLVPLTRRRPRWLAVALLAVLVGGVDQVGRTSGSASASSCAGGSHVVRPGDTWFGIAQSADVTIRELLEANSATERRMLHPGDRICFPDGVGSVGCSSEDDRYTVVSGDHWHGISRRSGVSLRTLLELNDADPERTLHPGDVLCVPAGSGSRQSGSTESDSTGGDASYTVRSGDSWFDIARRTGVTTRALLEVNEASERRIIHPGERLALPPGATAQDTSDSTGSSGSSGSGSSGSGSSGSGTSGQYTVVSGDSWFGIARRVQVSLRSLVDVNGTSDDRMLHPGEVIRLPEGADTSSAPTAAGSVRLDALPMHGPCWFTDSWYAPRGGGRLHVGVDLFAAMGSYVYAVVDGTLTARVWDQPGLRAGNGWWLTSDDGSVSFFYAHLDDFAPDLQVGSRVRAGQIIGFMGNTGNSAFPHLHFEIRPRGVGPINPYPIVSAAGGCKSGNGYEQPGGWVPTGGRSG